MVVQRRDCPCRLRDHGDDDDVPICTGVCIKGKRGHLTPPLEKMDEKLKSENMQKKSIFSTSECTIS